MPECSQPDDITPEDVQHAIEHVKLTSSPGFTVKQIRFDDALWHPLDHRLGSRRCRSFRTDSDPQPPVRGVLGNRHPLRHHWQMWRDCKAESDFAWLYRYTTCLIGRHRWQTWHRSKDGTSFTVCARCPAKPKDSP